MYAILADSAYQGLHPRIMPLNRGPNMTLAQRMFNMHAARIRQLVERAIGASENKWRIQQSKENRLPGLSGPEFAGKCTIAAAVMHNRYTNYVRM